MSSTKDVGHTKFKKTKIGMIPESWEVAKLCELCNLITDGSHYSPSHMDEGYPLATVANMRSSSIDVDSCYRISQEDYELLVKNKCKPQKGDILFSKDGTVGLSSVWTGDTDLVVLSSIAILRPYNEVLTSEYLAQVLQAPSTMGRIKNRTSGTAIKRIILRDLRNLLIPVPPLAEQMGISEILDDVDTLTYLEKKQQSQTQLIKKGLLQCLLIKGIGHTKFKKTKVGEIPECWEIQSIADCCDILDSQRVPMNRETRMKMQGDIPYYGANGVVDYVNDYIFNEDLILIAEDGGHFNEFSTRRIAYLISGKCWVNNHAHVLRAKEGYLREWIFYNLEHRDLRAFVKGGTRPKLNQADLRRIPIAIPPYQEQKQIADILATVDRKVELESDSRLQLSNLKNGLMQVLLTGKTRAKV